MTNVEKIKEGLKCCSHPKEENCNRCPYKYPLYPSGDRDAWLASCQEMFKDALEFIEDAIDLLKEQEAHVLTLDEAIDGNGCYYVEFQYHQDMGWVKCDFSRTYSNGEVAMLFTRDKNFYQQKEHYGQLWRLWDKRPTYDQRQMVKWDD